MRLGQVDERADADFEEGFQALAGGFGFVTGGIFTRQKESVFDPVGFGDWEFGHIDLPVQRRGTLESFIIIEENSRTGSLGFLRAIE